MSASAAQILERDLARGATVILDGATGTELERRGAPMHDGAWCAMASLTHPDLLRQVHLDYIRAGARVITTNTFSGNRNMLAPAGLADRFEAINRRAVALALEARDAAGVDGVVIAGSLSHQLPIVAGSDERAADAVPPAAVAARNFHELAALLAGAGVDILLLEMMSDPDLAVLALAAARATGLPVWIGFSVRRGGDGALHPFTRPDLELAALFGAVSFDGVGAAGIMHSEAAITAAALDALRGHWAGPLLAYPDSGYFEMPHWQFVDIMPPDAFAAACRDWRQAGVQILGGCCGLGVAHIEALRPLA